LSTGFCFTETVLPLGRETVAPSRLIRRRLPRAGRTQAGRCVVLITAGTRDEKMAFAGAARERKMKRLVQGMRRPKPSMKNALEAWQGQADGSEE
jgi:ERCC4-related helicase